MPIEALLEALHDEDWNVRWVAAEALGVQGKRVPIEVLLEALHDEDGDVREMAVRGFGSTRGTCANRSPIRSFA